MRYSYSRVECFNSCPHKYFLKYDLGLDTYQNMDDADNALILGSALHTGIEQSTSVGIKQYFDYFPVITDKHVDEEIKLRNLIPRVKWMLGDRDVTYEYKMETPDFLGYIDALIRQPNGDYAILDFKYSNNVDRYMESGQLHLYKHYFELLNPDKKVSRLGYIFVPKIRIRLKKTEDTYQFRKRLNSELEKASVLFKGVTFQQSKVDEYFATIKLIEATEVFEKRESRLCDYCDYRDYCKKGDSLMLLPNNVKREINQASRKKIWIYGVPFAGKSTLADQFPNALMLNTDGNINSFTSPYIAINDGYEGRTPVNGWDTFVSAIDELQKGNHSYETIVVDLIDDVYQMCRTKCCADLGIEHESDNNFKAWDYVRSHFLEVMKRLLTMPYNIVLISHEDCSKDLTRRNGDKITSVKPDIPDKVATRLSGMVDIVGRLIANGEERFVDFRSNEVVFGGGRLRLCNAVIPCSYAAIDAIYQQQNSVPMEAPTEIEAQPTAPAPEPAFAPEPAMAAYQPPVIEQVPTEAPAKVRAPRRRRVSE